MAIEERRLLAVNGTLMRGLPLEKNLHGVGATFSEETRTAACYRLWSVNGAYPAMLRALPGDPAAGEIAVELWHVPAAGVATLLAGEPDGLCIGRVLLCDGRSVFGVLGEPAAVEGQPEITSLGGWRAYLAASGKA